MKIILTLLCLAYMALGQTALDSGDFWWDTTLKKLRTATA